MKLRAPVRFTAGQQGPVRTFCELHFLGNPVGSTAGRALRFGGLFLTIQPEARACLLATPARLFVLALGSALTLLPGGGVRRLQHLSSPCPVGPRLGLKPVSRPHLCVCAGRSTRFLWPPALGTSSSRP